MSLEQNSVDLEASVASCDQIGGDLAVIGRLGVGVNCGWQAPGKTAYIHGTLHVKDRADVGVLGFNSTYPTLRIDPKAAAQLAVTGSLLLSSTPAGDPHSGAARIVVDGKWEKSGLDIVPLQIWRNSKGVGLGAIDAAGQLGLGTVKPGSLLHVAGETRIEGSLSIGSPTFDNRLTIQGGFGHRLPGAFSGKANIFDITGDNSGQLKPGDVLRIVVAGQSILTTENKDFFEVRSIASDRKSFVVVVAPNKDFSGSDIVYVDQSPLVLKNGSGGLLLAVDRMGNLSTSGSLTAGNTTVTGSLTAGNTTVTGSLTAGDTTITGSLTLTSPLKGTSVVGSPQITDQAVTLEKLVPTIMKNADNMLSINPSRAFGKGVSIDGPTLLLKGIVGVNLSDISNFHNFQMVIENELGQLQLRRRPTASNKKAVFLELFQPEAVPGDAYPSLRFHHGSKFWHRIEAQTNGIYFKHGDLTVDTLIPIWASRVNTKVLEVDGVTIGAKELSILKAFADRLP